MWQPGWEGSLGENGYMYMYGWVPLLFTWLLISYTTIQNKQTNKKNPQKTGQKQDTVNPIALGEKKQKNGKSQYTSLQYNDFLWKKRQFSKHQCLRKLINNILHNKNKFYLKIYFFKSEL